MEPACFCSAVKAQSPLYFIIAEEDEAGWEPGAGEESPLVQTNLFSAGMLLGA